MSRFSSYHVRRSTGLSVRIPMNSGNLTRSGSEAANNNKAASSEADVPGPKARLGYRRRAEDTAAGCRANALADLRRADEPAEAHSRWRYEHSAAAWNMRAEKLERFDEAFQALISPRQA